MNSAASLAAGLPVGRHAVRLGVLAAYTAPALVAWAALGLALTVLPLTGIALPAAAVYGGYYGAIELSARPGLPPPGRAWQVPQSMLIDAPPRRRVLIWGAILGPGFATRNPYAGFGLLPAVVASMRGAGTGIALAAAIGLAHGAARAVALLRDVRELSPAGAVRAGITPAGITPAGISPAGISPPEAPATHLDLLLRTVRRRRLDGAVLVAAAATAIAASLRYFT